MKDYRDKRFEYVGEDIRKFKITKFEEIFHVIPKSVMAAKLRTNNKRMTALIFNPELMPVTDLRQIAHFLGVTSIMLFRIVENQIEISEKISKAKANTIITLNDSGK